MSIAGIILIVAGVYIAAGIAFAGGFVLRGVAMIDPIAAHAGWGFRLLILPGAVALWPLLLRKWASAASAPEGPR